MRRLAGSEEEFDQAFQDHIKIWKELPNGEDFGKYLSDLSVTMKESMTAIVCVKAGLGNPTKRFYTNDRTTMKE